MFQCTVINPPAGARYWAADFYINGVHYWMGNATSQLPGIPTSWLKLAGQYQSWPVAGHAESVTINWWDSNYAFVDGKSYYYDITPVDGGQYAFDFAGNTFNTISANPKFSNITIGIVQAPTGKMGVVIEADYQGGDRIGNTNVRMAVGHDTWLPGFQVYKGMEYLKLITLSGTQTHYSYYFEVAYPSDMEPGKYDIQIVFGDAPWSGESYGDTVKHDAVTFAYGDDGTPEPGDGGGDDNTDDKTMMYLAIAAGVGLVLLAVMAGNRK